MVRATASRLGVMIASLGNGVAPEAPTLLPPLLTHPGRDSKLSLGKISARGDRAAWGSYPSAGRFATLRGERGHRHAAHPRLVAQPSGRLPPPRVPSRRRPGAAGPGAARCAAGGRGDDLLRTVGRPGPAGLRPGEALPRPLRLRGLEPTRHVRPQAGRAR